MKGLTRRVAKKAESKITRTKTIIKLSVAAGNAESIGIAGSGPSSTASGETVEQTRLGAGPIMEIISAVAIAIVVFFAGYRSIQGAITLGEFVSFLAALMLAYQPVRALAGINVGIQEGITAAKRIYEIIDQKNEIFNDENAPSLKLKNATLFNSLSKKMVILN